METDKSAYPFWKLPYPAPELALPRPIYFGPMDMIYLEELLNSGAWHEDIVRLERRADHTGLGSIQAA